MFFKSARYYDALYAFKDYVGSTAEVAGFVEARAPQAVSLLDAACGTGQHLTHLRDRFEVEGLDLNPELLDTARSRCPGVRFHQGDMAEFELGRTFDVVMCLFSSVAYVKTRERLASAIDAMASHLAPGGLLLVEPWFTPETFWVGHLASNYVEEPGLAISWMYVSELREGISVLDIHYQVGTPEGIQRFNELHEQGLFTADEYEAAFRAADLEPHHEPEGFFGRGLYWAQAGSKRPVGKSTPLLPQSESRPGTSSE